jgi:hypothetical protein
MSKGFKIAAGIMYILRGAMNSLKGGGWGAGNLMAALAALKCRNIDIFRNDLIGILSKRQGSAFQRVRFHSLAAC